MSSQDLVISRIRVSTWLRVMLAVSFGALTIALVAAATIRLASGWSVLALAEIAGAIVTAALLASSLVASCTVRVSSGQVVVGFWVIFRARIPASDVVELRADEWNSWDFGGYGLKGGRKKGWLLNATADGTGAGDEGVLIRTASGRSYRVEVRAPVQFAERAAALLGTRNVIHS